MRRFNEGEIPNAPDDLQSLIDQYDRSEISMGMDIEQEHNGGKTLDVSRTPLDTLKIVLAHMKEDPKYYTHLKAMEDKHGVEEGTTSRDSFRYDKSQTGYYNAPELSPKDFAQEDMDIDEPDPQYSSNKRTRTEGKMKNTNEANVIQKVKNKYHGTMEKHHLNRALYHDEVSADRDQSGHPTNALYHIEKSIIQSRNADKHRNKIKEGDAEDKKEKAKRLLWDEENGDMELDEVISCLVPNLEVKYASRNYIVKRLTESHVILEDSRGIRVALELEDIRGISGDNTIVTELDMSRLGDTLQRMLNALKKEM